MAEHDLVTTDDKGKTTAGPELTLSNKLVPELDDFNTEDTVELVIRAKITKIEQPEAAENVKKAVEPSKFTMELLTAEIKNVSGDRKKAEKMGLGMKEYKDIQSKRRGGSPTTAPQ